MTNLQSSLYTSSVQSYKNIQPNQHSNFVKYLHTQHFYDKPPKESLYDRPLKESQRQFTPDGLQEGRKQNYRGQGGKMAEYNPQSTPLLKRNQSSNNLPSKIYEQPSKDKQAVLGRFYESIVSSSQQKHSQQQQLNRCMANELVLKTEKQLLLKQNKKLKEQVQYLREKSQNLQKKNEQLFKNKSRADILDREYYKLLNQYERLKNNYANTSYIPIHIPLSLQHLTNQPTKIQSHNQLPEQSRHPKYQSKLLRGREVASRVINNTTRDRNQRINSKINWKRVSGVSPIYKIQDNRKYSVEGQWMVDSRVDGSEDGDNSMMDYGRENNKTLDLREIDKLREIQGKSRAVQNEVKELRLKNISLYKKGEQAQTDKIKFLEMINQLKYEKARQLSDLKSREDMLKKEVSQLKLQLESNQIRMLEMSEAVNNSEEIVKLAKLEREEIQLKFKKMEKDLQLNKAERENQKEQSNAVRILKEKYEMIESDFKTLKQKWSEINQKNEQNEIQKKLLEHQLQEKKEIIAEMQKNILRLKQQSKLKVDEQVQLQEQSKHIIKQDSLKHIQNNNQLLRAELNRNRTELNSIKAELSRSKADHKQTIEQHKNALWQINQLKQENNAVVQHSRRGVSQLQMLKSENRNLRELDQEWRGVERRAREMKRLDEAVDHLWKVKQAEYDNINLVLQQINLK